jgi:TPR repeat protein
MKILPPIAMLLTVLLSAPAFSATADSVLSQAYSFQDTDPKRFITLLESAARSGSVGAQYQLGQERLSGDRAEVNEETALALIRSAADSGLPSAKNLLGRLYAGGIGEPRNDADTPVKLLEFAGLKGEREAMVTLGNMYRYGKGVEIDYLEAAQWHIRASLTGYRDYSPVLDGEGNPLEGLDPDSAMFAYFYSIYLKGSQQNDPASLVKLGKALLEGSGGKPNPHYAEIFLGRAAAFGQPEAAPLLVRARAAAASAPPPSSQPSGSPTPTQLPPTATGQKKIQIK